MAWGSLLNYLCARSERRGSASRGADARAKLTPQMLAYDEVFSDQGRIRWQPYIMYFQPPHHRSAVVNTDSLGYRFTHCHDRPISVADHAPHDSVNVLAGSSTVFGIGASSDAATLASRLNAHAAGEAAPWINMGGRSHNSAQELVLHALLRHRLPRVERILLFSGFNDLGLAGLPLGPQSESGAFFMSTTFFERLEDEPVRPRSRREPDVREARERVPPGLDEQIERAAALVLRHLDVWRALAENAGAELTYALQPLAGWIRETGTSEEEALFAHLDELGGFSDTYGNVCMREAGTRYAELLRAGCESMGVGFADMAPLIADALAPDDWMFVDRIHFTDFGYDLTARVLLDAVV